MLASLEGLDHIVVMVKDLDAAADQWRELGFTLSPRGTHSAHLGTGNYTIMFDTDYVELLGVLQDTPLNASSREFLQRRGEGMERAAFTTHNAAEGVAALKARGIDASGPVEFSRPVDLPNGGHGEAAFSVFHWPADARPADMRIFACQHHTRNTVWIPELQSHPNTAVGIARLEIVTAQPDAAARQLAELIDGTPEPCEDGMRVPTAPGRGVFEFMTADAFKSRHPPLAGSKLPAEGVAALVCRVSDLDAAARCIGGDSTRQGNMVTAAADRANGVALVFEAA